MITANAKIASAAFAIIGNPAGVGNNKIPINKAKLMIIHNGLYAFYFVNVDFAFELHDSL